MRSRTLSLALGLLGMFAVTGAGGGQPATSPASGPTTQAVGGFRQIIPHGMIVHAPTTQPFGTTGCVGYEVGGLYQLDRTHCLLAASLAEQGGPDLCNGNDGFVFERLSDIRPERAIPLNRVETAYPLKDGRTAYMIKGPLTGGFIPLGALQADGSPHPAAGTGVLVCVCVAYRPDKSDPVNADKYAGDWEKWISFVEVLQCRWDGKTLAITGVQQMADFLGHRVLDIPVVSAFCPQDRGFIAPFCFDDGHHVVRFDWDGRAWQAVKVGPPYTLAKGESEPVIQQQGDRYLISTRGADAKVRIYASSDGLDFKLLFDWPNAYSPRSLNKGLDGSFYLATNPNQGWFRNPLVAYPMIGNAFGPPTTVHDQDGVRDDKGDKLPFVDHPRSANVLLEGRWRHFLVYRVCDLKERTLYGFQKNETKRIHGEQGPIPLRPTSGLYMAEMEYDKTTCVPFVFAR